MGTRHLICVVSDNQYRIAQYGQWDGYPEGQGAAILEFLKSPMAKQLKNNLERCSWITNDEYNKLWKEFGADATQPYIDCDVYQSFSEKYPQLSRDTGAKILKIAAGATGEMKLQNSLDFSQDSLFCEWAYVIDFDKNTFEVPQRNSWKSITGFRPTVRKTDTKRKAASVYRRLYIGAALNSKV